MVGPLDQTWVCANKVSQDRSQPYQEHQQGWGFEPLDLNPISGGRELEIEFIIWPMIELITLA